MVFLIVGITFSTTGFILKKFPPESINGAYGYRTPMSMKNKDTWDEAQKYGGHSMIILGIISCIIAAYAYLVPNSIINNMSIQLLFLLIGSVGMIVIDEVHLRKLFNKDGSRKLI